ncbi:MAG: carbohydrate ABC transporter permease [Candidatus Faecivicinus sp.]|nr:carbohydrate ABC transporter permease [Candidatus Faecivicinus sp.]
MVRKRRGERAYFAGLYVFLTFAALACLFPLMYVVAVSLTPYSEVLRNGGFVVIPREITLDGYKMFFENGRMNSAYGVTMFITVVGTALNIVLTLLLAYPLSKRELPGSRAVMLYVLFSMLFTGGTIPKYLIVKDLGLIDSIWSLILPIAITPYNVILMRTFFRALPEDLFEAALIDGANETQTLIRIAIPLAVPSIMTNVMFYAVMHWNTFMSALLYITKPSLQPLQVVLHSIISGSEQVDAAEYTAPTETLKMAAVVLTALPIIVVYPFIQKYFTTGMLLGAVKG